MGKHAQVMDSFARASDKPYLSVEETSEDRIKSSGGEVTFPANEGSTGIDDDEEVSFKYFTNTRLISS